MAALANDAIILCGGLGTRLRSVVADRPKPMAQVGDRPFLQILVDHIAAFGFSRFILCVGYKAEAVKAHFRDQPGRAFAFSEEKEPLGTAGALKLCEPLRRSETSLVLNGDSFCAEDPLVLLEEHARRGAAATVVVVPPEDRSDGGSVEVGPDGRITAFQERKLPAAGAGFLNAGVYAFGPRVFAAIPTGAACSLERETLPALVGRGLYARVSREKVFDIGMPERLEAFRRGRK